MNHFGMVSAWKKKKKKKKKKGKPRNSWMLEVTTGKREKEINRMEWINREEWRKKRIKTLGTERQEN